MPKSLYLVNPRSEIPTYFGAEVFEGWGFPAIQGFADLATTTVAALAPPDWEITICDEHIDPVDLDSPADFIGITGKSTQENRMVAIADEFRRRGKTVIIGGPFASLAPEFVRGHCDILVLGELEGKAEEFFTDLERGDWKEEYAAGERPDLSDSPVPRWELYNNERCLGACVQTSRGCPFECEFCDVIQYLGRKQRHKPIDQVIAELDLLYNIGYRAIFLSDDNLTVYRKRAKELLAALRDWNLAREAGPVSFATQVSIDAARDPEIMRLQGEAGMAMVFIGIETPNVESLKETKKRQNIGVDLIHEVEVFLKHGISVIGGMIVGFDNDGLDIFERQFEFAMAMPIPIFTLGALVAPHSTPLYDRMEKNQRLLDASTEYSGAPWQTNIVPNNMTREQLVEGLRWLCNSLYRPENFGKRMLRMIQRLGPPLGPLTQERIQDARRELRTVEQQTVMLIKKVVRQGKAERRMISEVFEAMAERPETQPVVMLALLRYAQARHLFEKGAFWEPHPADSSPFAAQTAGAKGPVVGNGLVTLGA